MALANSTTGVERRKAVDAQQPSHAPWPLVSLILGALSFIGMMVSIWMIFLYAPTDALQGPTQRIFYFHVPISWIGMLAFVVLAVASVIGLVRRDDERWDWIARAAAEIGTVFITLALISGAIWGKPIWGTWWTWDPKLTATLILWFMYVGYLMTRNYMGRTTDSARVGAVLALVGVVDVPIIYLSVQWWRGQHPTAMVGVPEAALPPSAVLTLMVALVTFTLLYAFLMVQVYQLQRLQTLAQRLRAIVE
ncbi:cytochrome C biogenesis protein CcmC [Reticulibacter mediterranei]|uniref:Heme exporter protein C n=1 Tax=Reticulibacter mediterranei TaxID=2778369 RepID=A0A8J3N232_9CHLR|nr:cytochrome c biogenesis protein CcsA [Reticulibacter mediterranei]GHO92785.1 cytochrome C biogenesis protein CcmC [Reticulibacter mediterranei]